MDMTAICSAYGLGSPIKVTPLSPGTEAQVWAVETEDGHYLLRTLTRPGQGELEWAIAQHLTANGFDAFPAILATREGDPIMELDGVRYQAQEFLPGNMPDPSTPGIAAAMARVIRDLSHCMPEGLIHGDLGPWNMVQDENGSIFVIDFGRTREGDPYFDYAAAFGGVINHTPPEDRLRACGEFLAALEADRPRLLTQLELWAEEGVSQWRGKNEKMVARFEHALKWAKENIYEL